MQTTTTTTPRVYVGTYAKYNNGSIKGEWLDLEDYSDRESLLEACAKVHADESDPEFMFQDWEGVPKAFSSESSLSDTLFEWLALDERERAAFGVYADCIGGDASVDSFREAYQGTADSESEFAERTAEDCGEIPKDLPSWIVIDWKASWECNLRHDYFCERDADGDLHFFRNI
jgi:antirestriction protein